MTSIPGKIFGWVRSHWRDGVSLVLLLLLGNILMEIGYRLYQHWSLPRELVAIVMQQDAAAGPASADRHVFDANVGYRYAPHITAEAGPPWNSHWQTNSYGHVSSAEYPQRKPPGEYRIAVVGDSMTANITNNVRWTELLEQHLNASDKWRQSVHGQFTRVINFGLDGTGMIQFAAMIRHHVLGFEPDLIIVNFISDSFFRRIRYNNMPYRGSDRQENIRKFVQNSYLDRINWFSLYPELFAATVGNLWGMPTSLPIDANAVLQKAPDFRFAERTDAIAASAVAIRDALSVAPNILFLHMPLYEEFLGQPDPNWPGLVEDVQRIVPEFKTVSVKPALEAMLPSSTDPAARNRELFGWFFLPADRHYNDYATSLYAREVSRLLIERPHEWRPAVRAVAR